MTSREFLQSHADPVLVQLVLRATESAKQSSQRTQLAHVVQELLTDSAVAGRLPEPALQAAKAKLADFIRGFPRADGNTGEIGFGIQSLFEPSIEMTRAMGGGRTTSVGFLATCLRAGILSDPASIQAQEILRASGVVLEVLGAPTPIQARPFRDYVFQSLGFGVDLTAMARDGLWSESPVVGMEEILEKLAMLVSSGRESVVLVGEPGVGKSVLVEGLAFHIARRTRPLIPAAMDNWTIVAISPTDLRADTGVQGALEARIQKLLHFFQENKQVIPFFDEVHTLLNTEDQSTRVLATAIKPAMARGAFRCIGATTGKEYARFITSDEAMKRRFVQLVIPEPDEAQTRTIVDGVLSQLLEGQPEALNISVRRDALESAVAVTTRYLRSEYQPAKSINLLRQVVMERVYRLLTAREQRTEIDAADIGSWFSRRTGIPVDALNDRSSGYYRHLRAELAANVFGQDRAIEQVVSWLEVQGSGWLDPRRPRGRFLFLGPSGVGKSELALQLAEKLMNDRSSVITRSMGDFSDQSARSTWQGAAPGYIGFGTTSTVYNEVLVRPYSVIVLDEFEKAHETLTELLLAMLDGYGQDAQGKRVDFSQCVFVMTSNAYASDLASCSEEELREALLDYGGVWQPQLLDRIDRIVPFSTLAPQTLARILARTIQKRQRAAARPLPEELLTPHVQQEILATASTGSSGSARRLERVLADWLIAHTRAGGDATQPMSPALGGGHESLILHQQ